MNIEGECFNQERDDSPFLGEVRLRPPSRGIDCEDEEILGCELNWNPVDDSFARIESSGLLREKRIREDEAIVEGCVNESGDVFDPDLDDVAGGIKGGSIKPTGDLKRRIKLRRPVRGKIDAPA